MSEFVKKTVMGYKVAPGGQTDPECTHVILSLREYNRLVQEKAKAEQETMAIKQKAERVIEEERRKARSAAQKAAEEARQTVEGYKGALADEMAESAHQRALNANLLRIARERANADRKLKPKKQHSGYLVVLSGEREHQYKVGKSTQKTLLWETVIQSPYVVDFPEEQVRKQIMEEFTQKNEDGNRLIDRLGIHGIYTAEYSSMIADREWCAEPERFNIMLNPKFRANFKVGYWEVVCLHTKPLGIVPKEMRAC